MNKKVKTVSVILVVALIVTMVAQMTLFKGNLVDAGENYIELTDEDNQKAAEIANVTGVNVKEILKLRESGLSFNEILNEIKNGDFIIENNENAVSDILDKELDKIGVTNEEIEETKTFIERVKFQLEEILSSNKAEVDLSPMDFEKDEKDDEIDFKEYQKVLYSLENMDYVIKYVLLLKNDIGSLESALNEYFISVQCEIDIKEYFENKEKYEEAKSEKSVLINMDDVITVMKIEDMMLKVLQNKEDDDKIDDKTNEVGEPKVDIDISETEMPDKPVIEMPKVEIPDPQADIKKELEDINPNDDLGN